MNEPVQHPDQIAEQLRRTDEYIRSRYGDGPIPAAVNDHGNATGHIRLMVSNRDGKPSAQCLDCEWTVEES